MNIWSHTLQKDRHIDRDISSLIFLKGSKLAENNFKMGIQVDLERWIYLAI